jgi:hypothetical protein
MRILIAGQVWAHPGHDQQSANLLTYEFARMFRALGNKVSFVCTYWDDRRPSAKVEEDARAALQSIDVDIIDPIVLQRPKVSPGVFATIINPEVSAFFPEVVYRDIANDLVRRLRFDVVFVPWSEMTTQLFAEADALRVAYYGNPDPKNWRINALPPVAPSRGWLRDLATRIRLFHLERLHLHEMRKYHLFGNVAANDAAYYVYHGIPDAFYTRMIYLDRYQGAWEVERERLESETDTIVIANIGSQAATGNMLALDYLARRVLSPLKQAFGSKQYEVHLYGGGSLRPQIAAVLNRPEVKNKGFIEDIDAALLSAQVFLCLNNATKYKVNQSRYLHVWSLGGCIVAHRDAALSLPEMVHNENALLGKDPAEIAELVAQAAGDKLLRRRIGRNGYSTYRRFFNADSVAADMVHRMQDALKEKVIATIP